MRTIRTTIVRAGLAAFILALIRTAVFAQANAAGVWNLEFTTPNGSMEFTMGLTQDGAKLAGHVTSAIGDFPLKGAVEGQQVRIVFVLPEQNKELEVTLTGTIDGDTLRGTAKLGDVGQGPMSADRIER